MEKKYQIVYIWSFIIISSVILLLLYTPLGGGLHQSITTNNVVVNPTIDFGGKIANSPKNLRSNYQPVNSNVEYESQEGNNIKSISNVSSGSGISQNYSSGQSTLRSSSSSKPISNSDGSISANMVLSSRSASSQDGTVASANLSQPFTESSVSQSSTAVIQKASNANPTIADPGGDPIGDPIPVGDGLIFLLVLSLGYVGFKHWKKK